jgi:hypothetical protein
METFLKLTAAVVLVALGMVGLHEHIEYSGFVLFVGCACALGA